VCSITAVIVCIFEHVQWRWALTDRLARRELQAERARAAATVRARRG
jgi:hypothetical protein